MSIPASDYANPKDSDKWPLFQLFATGNGIVLDGDEALWQPFWDCWIDGFEAGFNAKSDE